jgi:hypothetical protein
MGTQCYFLTKFFVKIKQLRGYLPKNSIFFKKSKFFMKREWAHSIPRQKLLRGFSEVYLTC